MLVQQVLYAQGEAAVAVGLELSAAVEFDTAFWVGVLGVAVRSAGTAVVTVLAPYVLKRKGSAV